MASNKAPAQTRLIHISDFEVETIRKRVKNVNLRVRRDGSVMMSVPQRMPWPEIEHIVRGRRKWIEEHRAQALATHVERNWREGDRAPLWGNGHVIKILADATARTEHVDVDGDTLTMHVTQSHASTDGSACTRRGQLYDAFLANELELALVTLRPSCEERTGHRASSIRLRRMTSRWGSCNVETRRITLNLELAERAPQCLEAVLCHELCHLHERGHNRRFYDLLDRACPEWREAHELLREPPHAMTAR